jgi:biopolymer transport protein ExbD
MAVVPNANALKAEPNLVPLLDLVFQLIMFFMICVNFVSAQVDQDIQLPVSQSARAMEKTHTDVLFLNVDNSGDLSIPGHARPLRTAAEVRDYLVLQSADAQPSGKEAVNRNNRATTTVIIRADKNCTYFRVYELLQVCKSVGYRKLQLRALIKRQG